MSQNSMSLKIQNPNSVSFVLMLFSILATVHVTICEGQGVETVARTVQEYLNSADSYTICDTKGIGISDTSETKGGPYQCCFQIL